MESIRRRSQEPRRLPPVEITQRLLKKSLPKYRKYFASKFISGEERERRKHRGPVPVYPSDFIH